MDTKIQHVDAREEETRMVDLLLWIGRLAGLLGFVVCAAAIAARVTGNWYLYGVPIGSLLQVGMAAMILACLGYAASLAERARK
jgi:hypothetical protein